MDSNNLSNAMGGQRVMTNIEEQWHFNQRRKSFDIIRVSNPTTIKVQGKSYTFKPKDFYVMYDTNQYQKFPPDSTLDVPRHIATRYVEHKKDEIINAITQKMHDDYIADRDKKGLPRYTDKSTENKETYETQDYPKTNDPAIIAEIYDQLWVGLVLESGRDIPPPDAMDPRAGEVDQKPASVKALEALDKRRVGDVPVVAPIRYDAPPVFITQPIAPDIQKPSPFAAMNDKLSADEVTNNE